MMRRTTGILITLGLAIAGCTGSGDPPPPPVTSTGPPTTGVPVATTTTVGERCPDVFCVVYYLRPEAAWSDGSPVVAADFVYTLESAIDPLRPDPGNPGYRLITEHQMIDDHTVLFAFSEPFAAWRTLFDVVLPAHGDPDSPGPTSGPFLLEERVEGDRIVLHRNPEHIAPDGSEGDVAELWFVFPDGIRGMIGELRRGEVDVINPRPVDWAVAELEGIEGMAVRVGAGPFWEQITFNFDDLLLSEDWMRQAIAMAIDREAVLDATVRSVDPSATLLGSTMFMQGAVSYQASYEIPHDPAAAEDLLGSHGCDRGTDGIYVCPLGRASFVWATTAGDEWREAQVAMAVDSLRQVGIEIVPRLVIPSEMFARQFFFGGPDVWQLMSFSWKAPTDPLLAESIYRCHGEGPHGMGALNVNRYCDGEVDVVLEAARSILDPTERALAYTTVDGFYLDDVAVIPLYQKPVLLAWNSTLRGPQLNPAATDLWNVGSWTGLEVVTVALGSEPSSLMSLGPLEDSAAMVRDALYLGAFGVDPSWRFVPELVSGAEAFMRGE